MCVIAVGPLKQLRLKSFETSRHCRKDDQNIRVFLPSLAGLYRKPDAKLGTVVMEFRNGKE